mgnify:CR=1 FL=1
MALLKTVPQQVAPQPNTNAQPSGVAGYEWQGVPIDVIRHFSVEMNSIPPRDIQQLKDITSWAKSKVDEPTVGNVLQKIATIQRQLGSPNLNEKSYSKVWQWVKLQSITEDIAKRQESLRASKWL